MHKKGGDNQFIFLKIFKCFLFYKTIRKTILGIFLIKKKKIKERCLKQTVTCDFPEFGCPLFLNEDIFSLTQIIKSSWVARDGH